MLEHSNLPVGRSKEKERKESEGEDVIREIVFSLTQLLKDCMCIIVFFFFLSFFPFFFFFSSLRAGSRLELLGYFSKSTSIRTVESPPPPRTVKKGGGKGGGARF